MSSTSKEATLRFSVFAMRDGRTHEEEDYYAKVDLQTGCVTQTQSDLATVWKTHHTSPPGAGEPHAADEMVPDPALDALKGTAFQKRWRDLLAFVGPNAIDPFGVFTVGTDAKHVAVRAGDWQYLSADGGTTFRRVDTAASYNPRFSLRGDAVVFSHYLRPKGGGHHYELATTSADSAGALTHMGPANPRDFFFTKDGASVIVASYRARDKKACVHRVTLATKKSTELFCAPSHEQSLKLTASPGAAFALLKVQEVQVSRSGNPTVAPTLTPLDPVLHLIDVERGSVVGNLTATRGAEGIVDDRGQVAWSGYVDTAGGGPILKARVMSIPGKERDLGRGTVLGWAPGGRLVIGEDARLFGFGGATALGPNGEPSRDACGWVRVVAVGGT